MSLKIDALKKYKALEVTDLTLLIQSMVCDTGKKECMYNMCSLCKDNTVMMNFESNIEIIEFNEWVRQLEIFEKDGGVVKIFKTIRRKNQLQVKMILKANLIRN